MGSMRTNEEVWSSILAEDWTQVGIPAIIKAKDLKAGDFVATPSGTGEVVSVDSHGSVKVSWGISHSHFGIEQVYAANPRT